MGGRWGALQVNKESIKKGVINNMTKVNDENVEKGENIKYGGFYREMRRNAMKMQPLVTQLSVLE